MTSFLSQRICQDPLERFFGIQRQRGGVNDNPNVAEFTKNTQAIRFMNTMCHTKLFKGNCRGSEGELPAMCSAPLPKRRRTSSKATVDSVADAVVSGMFV